jgi:Holliday junction resolvasome RuvABC endonuclease subunit
MSTPQFKVITSSSAERFEERLVDFIESLGRADVIDDVQFRTCAIETAMGHAIEFSALVRYHRETPAR